MMLALATLLTLLLSTVRADVKFTSPSAGEVITGTKLEVIWGESGISPPINEFSSYSLALCAGGNNYSNFIQLSTLTTYSTFSNGLSFSGVVYTGWGANTTNAYFLKLIGSVCNGEVTNYSPRFSLPAMTGSFPPNVVEGLATLSEKDTQGPDRSEAGVVKASCSTYMPSVTAIATLAAASSAHFTSTVTGLVGSYTTTTDTPVATTFTTIPASNSSATVTLSEGALAGIIVGAIVGFMIISGLALVIVIGARRRLARHNATSIDGFNPRSWNPLGRRKNRGLERLTSTEAVNELDANAVCKELDADTNRTGRQEILGSPITETAGTPVSELPCRKSMKSIYEMAAD